MKNHFYFSYFGNKRNEFKELYPHIKNILDGDEIEYIIEPYCGSCAISCAISQLYPKKFKYILNDTDKNLISLLKISQDKLKFIELNKEINELAKQVEGNKEEYLKIIKNNSLASYFIKSKIYNIRQGLFKTDYKYKPIDLTTCPIYDFLNSEEIILLNKDGFDVLEKYKDNSKCFIFLDPPYLFSENGYYDLTENKTTNIYEYCAKYDLKQMKSYIILILNINWINRLIFRDYGIIEYDKKYETTKKKLIHGIISNK